jgi:hypothetical protein
LSREAPPSVSLRRAIVDFSVKVPQFRGFSGKSVVKEFFCCEELTLVGKPIEFRTRLEGAGSSIFGWDTIFGKLVGEVLRENAFA